MDKTRSYRERIESLNDPIDGTTKDPAVRRHRRRLDAVFGVSYVTRVVSKSGRQPDAFDFLADDGTSELVERVKVWTTDQGSQTS